VKSIPNESFDRDKANEQVNYSILKILVDELPDLKKHVADLCNEVRKAKYIIYAFSIALFVVGLFFLIAALLLTYSQGEGPENWQTILEAFGFGSAGASSFVALLILHPADKIQKINSDASQAQMIYHNWQLGILLYIRAMDINDRESIKEAANNIQKHTATAIKILENYTEKDTNPKE
jgi:hypothetical protein